MPDQFIKDPNAVKDYLVDWGAKRLTGGETISTSTWVVPAGITKNSDTNTTTTTTIWLSGGTSGVTYLLTNRVVTSAGRTDDWTLTFIVQDT